MRCMCPFGKTGNKCESGKFDPQLKKRISNTHTDTHLYIVACACHLRYRKRKKNNIQTKTTDPTHVQIDFNRVLDSTYHHTVVIHFVFRIATRRHHIMWFFREHRSPSPFSKSAKSRERRKTHSCCNENRVSMLLTD